MTPVAKKLYILDIKYNALKSNIIRYAPKYTYLNIKLRVDSIAIPCVNRVKYLGVYLMSAKSFKVCWHEPKKILDRQHHR